MMQPHAQLPTMADRFCNAWAWVCLGFTAGFATSAMLSTAGYTSAVLLTVFWMLASATAFVSVLPRTILELSRRLRRHRQLAGS